jgi:hypothetical protein
VNAHDFPLEPTERFAWKPVQDVSHVSAPHETLRLVHALPDVHSSAHGPSLQATVTFVHDPSPVQVNRQPQWSGHARCLFVHAPTPLHSMLQMPASQLAHTDGHGAPGGV